MFSPSRIGKASTAVPHYGRFQVTFSELRVVYANVTTRVEEEIEFEPNQTATADESGTRLSGELKEKNPKAKAHRFEAVWNFDHTQKKPQQMTLTWIEVLDDQFQITIPLQACA